MERKLSDLSEKLVSVFGDRLLSVILYGSAAMDDWQERRSDLNILCVLKKNLDPRVEGVGARF